MNYEGNIEDKIQITYDSELYLIEENERIRILSKISNYGCQADNTISLLQFCLEILNDYFPHAQRKTFLTYSNNELIPRVFYPQFAEAYFSYTLAQKSLEKEASFLWTKRISLQEDISLPSSLIKVCSAIYAPIMFKSKKIGIIHLDSISNKNSFSNTDLQLITMIANTLSPALMIRNHDNHEAYPKVFISYSHKDKNFVFKFAKHLRKRQIRVWLDERIEAGNSWKKEISDAIKSIDYLIWIASPDSIKSEMSQWETILAQIEKKVILPIIYKKCKLPSWADDIQWINYDNDLEKLVHKVSERVK
ncbi:adenylate cyclase [Candidatus Magnetomorum sp. HK-1]|nr:adenylate cyclase [Candidatus Magnetomorum sp. HK-1]